MTHFRGTKRFIHPRCLGIGSFGSVFEVFDLERQARVALKIPHDATAQSLFLFKKEFRTLADLSHPNLLRLHELVSDETQWFFTMELVDGLDILRYLRSESPGCRPPSESARGSRDAQELTCASKSSEATLPGNPTDGDLDDGGDATCPSSIPVDFQRITQAFTQLGEGLMTLHGAGLLHMDIKPSNVLVTREGRIVILDFGLTIEIESAGVHTKDATEITGTPAYMAPEQLLDNRCSEASDWYSVGVLLYHVLTGRLPFQGNGLRVLINKVSQPPPAPAELVAGIPDDLSALCVDLLSPHPESRPTGEEFLRRLEASERCITQRNTQAARHDFFGRTEELESLCSALKALRNGHAGWVNLHGGSGMGKTFLIRRFRREIARTAPEALILSGRCYEQEHVPFKALDGLVDDLSRYLKNLSHARLESLLPRHIGALAQLFPVLRQVPRIAEFQKRHAAIADPPELRHRAFSALRGLLGRIGESTPLVLVIDDLHWGDADSAVLMADLVTPPHAPLMLVVACFRTEETGTSPVLREFLSLGRVLSGHCTDIPIRELPEEASCQLARSLLETGEPINGSLVDWIVREAAGNPFFIHELARHARDHGGDSPACENLETYIQLRVGMLPAETRQLLELVALAGHPLDWPILREAARAEIHGAESLDVLRQAHLVRLRSIGTRRMVEPYHDFVRKSVSSILPPDQRREAHLRLAIALEHAAQPDVPALALHYQAAGASEKALDYLTTAGLQAFSSLAFAKAASMLRMALALRDAEDPGSAVIWGYLGEALANAGRGKEAAEAYLRASRHAEPREANRLLRVAAQEYLKSGHYQEGVQVLDRVLNTIGAHLAPSQAQALFSALFHKAWIYLRGLHFRERPQHEIAPEVLDRLDSYWAVTLGLATGDIMRVADFQARLLLLSLRTGEPVRLVRAFSYEAIFTSSRGSRSEHATRKYIDLALMLAERIGDPDAKRQALVASGIALTALGQWRKGAEILDKAEAQLRENTAGLSYELRNAQSYSLINHYALGNLTVLAERLPVLIRDAEDTGDLLFLANLKMGSAFLHYLALDEPDRARQEIHQILDRLPAAGFSHQRFHELAALGNIDLYSGNLAAGWTQMQERWRALRDSRMLMVQTMRITCLELRGRMALALAASLPDKDARRSLLRRAHRDALAIQRERACYGTGLAARLLAVESALSGRREDANGYAFLAETHFEASDMALHAQVMKRYRGLMKGGETGKRLVRESEDWMRRQGVVSPARLAAMFLPVIEMED